MAAHASPLRTRRASDRAGRRIRRLRRAASSGASAAARPARRRHRRADRRHRAHRRRPSASRRRSRPAAADLRGQPDGHAQGHSPRRSTTACAAMLACCVDLDRDAQDTDRQRHRDARNGRSARASSSLIVVTSDYHMPRSMVELAEAMPDMRLIAFPVSNPELHLSDWWRDPDAFGLLAPRIRQVPARRDAAGAPPAGANRKRGRPADAPARG